MLVGFGSEGWYCKVAICSALYYGVPILTDIRTDIFKKSC